MEIRNDLDLQEVPDNRFVTESDWIPSFWNYILGLKRNGLIAELIQNDLDQDATRTVISFEQKHLVCEGNGRPVDSDGWQRLRKIQGAGDSVPAKRGKIGVKNHGLKTAFTIGDEICLMSDRKKIIQTLYANGQDKPPYPGASLCPINEPAAPAEGCRIIVRYRDAPLEMPQGEAGVLGAVTSQELNDLFLSAYTSAPEQFAGIVSPEVAKRYEIVLRHWQFGEVSFQFSCTRPRKLGGRIELFRRHCEVRGNVTPLPNALQEQAARRLIPLKSSLRKRVADFFRRGNRFFIEVSWPILGNGKPCTGSGRFRYPIGYSLKSSETSTGHSTYFNAPFVSDNKRDALLRDEPTNRELRAECEALLIDVFARHILPRWGANGLNPLVPSPQADNHNEAVRPLLTELIRRNAMPTLKWRDAVDLLSKRKRLKIPAILRRARSSSARKYNFILPVPKWEESTIHPALCVISPSSERQIDPRIHPDVLQLLTDGDTEGFSDHFITFDEEDALSRATGEGNEYFDAPPDLEKEFTQPFIARAYLDVIYEALAQDKCDDDTEEALLTTLLLPDVYGRPTRLDALYSSALLPYHVPGLRLPPILNVDLAPHPIFRRRKWHRPKYTMARFLESDALHASNEHTRRLFWKWLRQNEKNVATRDRPKLADVPVWPDENGNLCLLSDICDPRSRKVSAILADTIQRPHKQVLRSKIISISTRSRMSIRRLPIEDEIKEWVNQWMSIFIVGVKPDNSTSAALNRFEADLAYLLKDAGISRLLKSIEVTLPALAQDDSIQHRTALVMPTRSINRLALCGRFLLKKSQHAVTLDKLSRSLSAPTAAMLLETFAEDSGNFTALQPRLQQFLNITQEGDDERLQLSEMPIIPVHGEPRPPATLAFTGTKGDYWGDWKTRLSGNDLSQEDQRRYRSAGVTSALPNRETSQAFFKWLSGQPEDVLARHITCVLRHILHREGPVHWAEIFTDTPFIPAKGHDGIRLVTLRTARNRPVFLPDAGTIGDAVILKDRAVLLVIDHVTEVSEPVSEPLRKLGVRSLREVLKDPVNVFGSGNINPARANNLSALNALRSTQLRSTFLKRLNELDVETEQVRFDWQNRLSQILSIQFSDEVQAHYLFRGKNYKVEVDAGFDPGTGIFWMKGDRQGGLSNMYEAIAEHLVFKPATRRVYLLALERAVEMEVDEPSFGRPTDIKQDLDVDIITAPNADSAANDDNNNQGDGADTDLGEAVFGHSPFEPDATRNMPIPSPISLNQTEKLRHSPRRNHASAPGKSDSESRPTPELEKEHIEALKRDHYASHCQMCLCNQSPHKLAPLGSYIHWEEVRRRIIDAHHVDLVSAGGARHAGNLILLCKLHHDNYGRVLTRKAITAVLNNPVTKKVIRFSDGDDQSTEVAGRILHVTIPSSGEVVKFFFTEQHASYWLAQAEISDSK